MESKDYLLNDGKSELKLTKISLDKQEWTNLLNKLVNDKVKVQINKIDSIADANYINNINKRKFIPLITNEKLFPDKGHNLSIVHGNLGNLYFRLHWALNACPQTSEILSNIDSTPEKVYSDFAKWWNALKLNDGSTGHVNINKIHSNKFRINDLVGFLSNSIDYNVKIDIKTEEDYDNLHVKYIMPWTFATEICLYLNVNKIIDLPDKEGFITIKY